MVVKKPESVWKKAEVWGFDTEGMIQSEKRTHPFLATALPYLLFAPAVINLLGEHEAREQVGLDDGFEPTGTDVFDRADELTGPW